MAIAAIVPDTCCTESFSIDHPAAVIVDIGLRTEYKSKVNYSYIVY